MKITSEKLKTIDQRTRRRKSIHFTGTLIATPHIDDVIIIDDQLYIQGADGERRFTVRLTRQETAIAVAVIKSYARA